MYLRNNMAVLAWRFIAFRAVFVVLLINSAYGNRYAHVEAFFQGECSQLSPCHHICLNLPDGGFECACKAGFQLHSNGFSCIEEPNINHVKTTLASAEPTHVSTSQEEDVLNSIDLDNDDVESLKMLALDENEDVKTEPSKTNTEQSYRTQIATPQKKSLDPDTMQGDGGYDYNNHHLYKHKLSADRDGKKKGRRKHRKHVKNRYQKQQDGAAENGGAKELANSILFTNIPNKVKPKFATCQELKCQARGLCVGDSLRGGVRCQCQLGTAGEFCEKDLVVRYPKFMGTGYVAFPVLRGAYKQFSISIEFRPDTLNGLLLFSAQHPDAHLDFFSVSLVNGYVEFKFDCGSGPSLLRSQHKVKLGEWNRVSVQRDMYNGWLRVNGDEQVRGRSKGTLTRISFSEDLYLGGYRNISKIGTRTGMQWGFVGCVRFLEINNKVYDMRRGAFVGDAIHGRDVGECSSHLCDAVTCKNGGTCVANSADTHMCMCPLDTEGEFCEKRMDIHVPSFNGNSYLQYLGLKRTVLSFTDIEIVFKPMDRDGLILYNGYTTDKSGDFVSVAMVDGYLEYRFDLGTGPAIMRSLDLVALDEWHRVKVSRTGRDGYMEVDSQPIVEGMSQGAYTQLTLIQDMFIGGHRNFDEVSKHAGVRRSYTGCLQKVIVNDRPMKLLQEALTGVNVGNCRHPCVGKPCLNGGTCIPMQDFYKCSCPLGFENTNCEDKLNSPVKIPMFSGDSYLLYTSRTILNNILGKKVEIEIRLKAKSPDGLIFWSGEKEMTPSSDYLSIGLVDGHVRYSYNLGSGEVHITYNGTRVDDGKWHKIRVQRYRNVGYLEIDGTEAIEGTSPGSLTMLNTNTLVYIGGTDDNVHMTLKKYLTGFVGCISSVTLATDYEIDLIGQTDEGQNVRQCT